MKNKEIEQLLASMPEAERKRMEVIVDFVRENEKERRKQNRDAMKAYNKNG